MRHDSLRVHPLKSLSAKLFYLTIAVTLVTVAGNSWQNNVMFRRVLENQTKDNVLSDTNIAAGATAQVLDHWRLQLVAGLRAAADGASTARRDREFVRALEDSRDLVAFAVYQLPPAAADAGPAAAQPEEVAFVFRRGASAADFDGRSPETVAGQLHEGLQATLARQAGAWRTDDPRLINVAPAAQLPLLALCIPFAGDAQARFVGALVARAAPLVDALPSGPFVRARLVDAHGTVLASRAVDEILARASLAKLPLAAEAARAKSAGGLKSYVEGGETWLGAYHRVNETGTTVLVETSAKGQRLATETILRRSALWGWAFVLLAILLSFFTSSGVTAALRAVTVATQEIASGNLKARLDTKSSDEVGVLGASVAHMASRIEVLLEEQATKTRLAQELETARLVQAAFFTNEAAAAGDTGAGRPLRVHGFFQPATECGGDWWGQFPSPDGSLFVCIGDATGHGAAAALITAMAYSCCMTTAALIQEDGRSDTPARLLGRLNDLLLAPSQVDRNMTFFVARFDMAAGTLTYANAGHNFPMLIPARADDDRLIGGARHRSLALGGNVLGVSKEATFREETLELGAGDQLVLFTDGLVECRGADDRPWSRKRLGKVAAAAAAAGLGGAGLLEAVRREAFHHYGARPLADDVTIVVAEIAPDWAPAKKAA